jgi:signal transduction histidine kinase
MTMSSQASEKDSRPSSSASQDGSLSERKSQSNFGPVILFFHVVFILGLALGLFFRFRRADGGFGWADAALIGLVAIQVPLYVWCFAIPTFNDRWLPLRWWWAYYAASVAIVFAESRIEHAYEWVIICYLGQVCALPLRVSVPVTIAVLVGFLLNKFGWSNLAGLTAWQWIMGAFAVCTWMILLLFFGRVIATSAEQAKLIVELEAAKRELELARQRDAELAVLRERERLARDLHDSLGHSLVTLTVQLEAAQRLLATDPARAATQIAEMQKLTRSSMEDLRRSLANLRAPGLGDCPLTEALQTLCADAGKRCGASMECALADSANRLPPVVAEVLWRVAQEGLTNVERHAQAQRVQVSLAMQSKEILLRVTDDGIGLPADAEDKPGHFGLRGLRERVEGLGGTFTLTTAGSKGTLIEARVPMIA